MDGIAFAQRVRALVAKRGLKIGAVMEAAGLHRKFLSNLTKTDPPPKNGPTLESLVGLRRALGTSWSELLDDDGEPDAEPKYSRDLSMGSTIETLETEVAALEQRLAKKKRELSTLLGLVGQRQPRAPG